MSHCALTTVIVELGGNEYDDDIIILGPDAPNKDAGPDALWKVDGAAKESSSGPSAKKPNSKNIAIEETGPHNEAKEFDQNELVNQTVLLASQTRLQRRKETEPDASSKKGDADILAKETDANSVKRGCTGCYNE